MLKYLLAVLVAVLPICAPADAAPTFATGLTATVSGRIFYACGFQGSPADLCATTDPTRPFTQDVSFTFLSPIAVENNASVSFINLGFLNGIGEFSGTISNSNGVLTGTNLTYAQQPCGGPPTCGIRSGTAATFRVTGGVPEPTTWAMMLIGFSAVGVSLRRRRSSVRFA